MAWQKYASRQLTLPGWAAAPFSGRSVNLSGAEEPHLDGWRD